jgi:ferritin-like protein
MTEATPEVRERLLKAWRGEIEAGGMYELIAQRLPEREGEIMRRMAQAESRHRERLETRMRELGVEVPSPDSVRLSPWARLQARIAPVDRLLAAREAAEDEEVDGLYKHSTGDPTTDRLLHDIRKEERSHSMAVGEMRSGESGETAVPPALSANQQRAKARLDKIMGREKWHQTSGGWISGAIYGANDGLASVFGIVAGVSGATGGSSFVLTAGAAGAIASALSMATGAFLAERAEAEVAEANLARERAEIEQHPEEEKEELSLFYQLKGVDEQTADAMAEQIALQPEAFLQALAMEEFGGAVRLGRCSRWHRRSHSLGLAAQQLYEPLLLLSGPALEPGRVAALDQLVQDLLDGCERGPVDHTFAAASELPARLRPAQQQDGEHGELLASESQRLLGEVAVLGRAARVSAGEAGQAVARKPLGGVAHRLLGVGDDRVAVRRLIAREAQRVEAQRVLIRSREALLEQAPQHALLGGGERVKVHRPEGNAWRAASRRSRERIPTRLLHARATHECSHMHISLYA